jgi:hypothetical protein
MSASVNARTSTNDVLDRFPSHPRSNLCLFTHANPHVFVPHRGHVYLLGASPHVSHVPPRRPVVVVVVVVVVARASTSASMAVRAREASRAWE